MDFLPLGPAPAVGPHALARASLTLAATAPCLLSLVAGARARGLVVLLDSPDPRVCAPSWGYGAGGSPLELVSGSRFLVDTMHL